MEQNSNEKDRENLSMEEYLKRRQAAVSYTHLTLPTICSV